MWSSNLLRPESERQAVDLSFRAAVKPIFSCLITGLWLGNGQEFSRQLLTQRFNSVTNWQSSSKWLRGILYRRHLIKRFLPSGSPSIETNRSRIQYTHPIYPICQFTYPIYKDHEMDCVIWKSLSERQKTLFELVNMKNTNIIVRSLIPQF